MKTDKVKYITMAVTVALSIGTAYAAPNVANVTQKGSLLIWPKVVVKDGHDTIVNIENDGNSNVSLKCYWRDTMKNFKDFIVPITAHQKCIIDAKNGASTCGGYVGQFPTYNDSKYATGVGELKCWAITDDGATQLAYNQLTGKAIELDFKSGTAMEYQAWSFYNRAAVPAGLLVLNGAAYDFAPQYLVGGFMPKGATITSGNTDGSTNGTMDVLSNTLYVSSATQDLTQDGGWIVTKLDFDIWNGNEVKLTNAWRCSDSVFVTPLDVVKDYIGVPGVLSPNPMNNGTNFLYSSLGTKAALFRVQGNASSQCAKYHIEDPGTVAIPATYTPVSSVGLLGILVTEVNVTSADTTDQVVSKPNVIGTALNAAGQKAGSITYDPTVTSIVAPEKQ